MAGIAGRYRKSIAALKRHRGDHEKDSMGAFAVVYQNPNTVCLSWDDALDRAQLAEEEGKARTRTKPNLTSKGKRTEGNMKRHDLYGYSFWRYETQWSATVAPHRHPPIHEPVAVYLWGFIQAPEK